MGEIQRYDLDGYDADMVPHSEGDWVRLEDHKEQLAARDKQIEILVVAATEDKEKEIERLKALVESTAKEFWALGPTARDQEWDLIWRTSTAKAKLKGVRGHTVLTLKNSY